MATIMDEDGLDQMIAVLAERGYTVIGPTVLDNAIVLDEVDSVRRLPAGWAVDTAPGRYELRRRDDQAMFANSAGPQSWKRFLHPPRRRLWSGDFTGFEPEPAEEVNYAFLGVRGCDLAAIAKLDRVLGAGTSYGGRRRNLFVIAVNCTEPGGVCFCVSMGTGPAAGPGYDLALTERADERGHFFVVETGSEAGAEIVARVATREASEDEAAEAREAVEEAAHHMGRAMPEGDLKAIVADARESPHWEDIANRCLTCGNCTMVCPTCFCTTTEDVTDLSGDHAERWQHWASCFEIDFSYLHGGSVRTSAASRYRQWMSHKLSTWHDQFGSSGCVGCGRCIAWCPAGIDITAEAAKLAGS